MIFRLFHVKYDPFDLFWLRGLYSGSYMSGHVLLNLLN